MGILCVGLVCTDIINVVSSYPVEDSDQRTLEQRWQRGGNASNMCSVLSILNAPCEFMGSIAIDNNVGFLKGDFEAHKIPYDHCVYYEDCEMPTSVVIINKTNGSRTILHGDKNLPELTPNDFRKIDLASKKYKWIHFEGRRNCGNILQMLEMIEVHNSSVKDEKKRIITSVELEKTLEVYAQLHDKANYIFISKDYAQFRGFYNMEDAVRNISKQCRHGSTVICPWGEVGAAAFSSGDQVLHTSPSYPPPSVIDTLGAGDAFIAATIHSLSQNPDVKKAIIYGCKIAGAKVGMKGYSGLKDMATSLE